MLCVYNAPGSRRRVWTLHSNSSRHNTSREPLRCNLCCTGLTVSCFRILEVPEKIHKHKPSSHQFQHVFADTSWHDHWCKLTEMTHAAPWRHIPELPMYILYIWNDVNQEKIWWKGWKPLTCNATTWTLTTKTTMYHCILHYFFFSFFSQFMVEKNSFVNCRHLLKTHLTTLLQTN